MLSFVLALQNLLGTADNVEQPSRRLTQDSLRSRKSVALNAGRRLEEAPDEVKEAGGAEPGGPKPAEE